MTVRDVSRTMEKHHRGHSLVAPQAIDAAWRCDEHDARQRVAVTRVRALLVELGHTAQVGAREPFGTRVSAAVAPVEILAGELAPR